MASYRKRGKQSWQLIVELGYDAKNQRETRYKTIKVTDPALLRAPRRLEEHLQTELRRFQIEAQSGHYIETGRMSFPVFLKEWEANFVKAELEVKTIDNYLFHTKTRIKPYFESMYMEQIKTMHILKFMESLRGPNARLDGTGPLKSASLVYIFRVLRSIFRKAKQWNVITENPMDGISKPKEDDKKEMEVYNEDEINALFEALEEEPLHIRVLVILAVTTGMRRAELAGLEWSRVDFDQRTVEISPTIPKFINGEPYIKLPKNKKPRTIAIPESTLGELAEFKSVRDEEIKDLEEQWRDGKYSFVFCHPNGKPYDPQTLTDWWITFHRKHGLKPIRLHDLRHTSASWMIFKKVHSEAIAKRLGHSNVKMLEIYGHIFRSVDQAAASVFDDIKPTKK